MQRALQAPPQLSSPPSGRALHAGSSGRPVAQATSDSPCACVPLCPPVPLIGAAAAFLSSSWPRRSGAGGILRSSLAGMLPVEAMAVPLLMPVCPTSLCAPPPCVRPCPQTQPRRKWRCWHSQGAAVVNLLLSTTVSFLHPHLRNPVPCQAGIACRRCRHCRGCGLPLRLAALLARCGRRDRVGRSPAAAAPGKVPGRCRWDFQGHRCSRGDQLSV